MPASGFARHATTTHSAGNAPSRRLLCNGASGAKTIIDGARAEPMHDKADLSRALQLARAGSNAAALKILEVLLARTPDEPEVLQLIGMVLRSQGKHTEAEQYLRRSLHAAPDRAHVHSNLGNLLAHQQRHAEAIECYRSGLSIAPDYADAWYNLGTVALRTGDPNTARDALE